jgi:UDP-N-acetylglucosamine pyrophosphorylase
MALLQISFLINVIEVICSSKDGRLQSAFSTWLQSYEVFHSLESNPVLLSLLPSSETKKDELRVASLLLKFIFLETNVFVSDLFTYELDSNKSKNEEDQTEKVLPDKAKQKQNTASNEEDAIPVTEILISAHLILLLHTIIFGKITKNQIANPSLLPKMNPLASYVCDNLPKRTFWLFVRVLKAFLALQGQV